MDTNKESNGDERRSGRDPWSAASLPPPPGLRCDRCEAEGWPPLKAFKYPQITQINADYARSFDKTGEKNKRSCLRFCSTSQNWPVLKP